MTTPDGSAFYDDNRVFEVYMARRKRADNPNDLLEKPVILELAGNLERKRILDLGCGDAGFGREAVERGCATYLGVEGSHNMVRAAQQVLAGTGGEVVQATLETWDYPVAAFDLVVARLVLHYLQAVDEVFAKVQRALVEGGRFVFSVEHPVITSSDLAWQGQGPRQNWVADDYFHTGLRQTTWMGSQVIKYHRTVEDYFASFQRAGFAVEALREAAPNRELFQDEATYERRRRIPLFLIMSGQKRAAHEEA